MAPLSRECSPILSVLPLGPSQENIDVYTTHEPQLAFHKRISFCLNIHNDAVKVSALTCAANLLLDGGDCSLVYSTARVVPY